MSIFCYLISSFCIQRRIGYWLQTLGELFKKRKMKILIAVDGSDTAEKAFNCKLANAFAILRLTVCINSRAMS